MGFIASANPPSPLGLQDRKGIGTLWHDRYLRLAAATLLIRNLQGLGHGGHPLDAGLARQFDIFFARSP
jgi:hypothetical protein